MTIKLAPDQEQLMERKLQAGGYLNPEHLAAEALKLLEERDQRERQLHEVRQAVEQGWQEAERKELARGDG